MSHSHSDHHHHHHGHGHGHGCGSHSSNNIGRLVLVLVLTAIYMGVEFWGGIMANSLALIADAGHMLTDVGAVGLALFAAWFAEHPPSPKRTYGYYRLEIFAAFLNGVALALISLYIFYEAWQRFQHPEPIKGFALIWIATGGLVINLISAAILFSAGKDNINIRGALLHVISDCIGSVAAIIAGLVIIYTGFTLADPILSVLLALLVLYNAYNLIQETTNVLLEGCPVHLNVTDIEKALVDLHEIRAVHDLHVWSITMGKEAMSVHVVVDDLQHFCPGLITKIQHTLKDRFGLTHVTVQLEPPDFEEDEIHF